MTAETPIKQVIKKFEDLKAKAEALRDIIYLDGVLAVLETSMEDEKEYIERYARLQIEKHMERVKAQIAYDDGATTIEDSFNIVPIDLD